MSLKAITYHIEEKKMRKKKFNSDFLGEAKKLVKKQEEKGSPFPKMWVYYVLFDLVIREECLRPPTQDEMVELSQMLGYKLGWAVARYREIKKNYESKERAKKLVESLMFTPKSEKD